MSLFEIVLPTYNRSEAVKFLLEKYNKFFGFYDFVLSIHDSSTNDETEKLVKSNSFYNKGIQYYRYPSELDVDSKTLMCLKNSTAKYSMLVGDGWIINVDSLFNSKLLDENFDILCLYDSNIKIYREYFNKNIKHKKIYDSKTKFYEDNFWYLIMYGSSIVSRKVLDSIDVLDLCNKYKELGFIYPSSLVESNAEILTADSLNLLTKNPHKGEPGWMLKRDAINTWTRKFILSFGNMNDSYLPEDTKLKIIKTTGKRTGFLTIKGLLILKSKDNFNFKINKKYKQYILQTKACSRLSIFMINLFPTFILKIMLWFFKKIFR